MAIASLGGHPLAHREQIGRGGDQVGVGPVQADRNRGLLVGQNIPIVLVAIIRDGRPRLPVCACS